MVISENIQENKSVELLDNIRKNRIVFMLFCISFWIIIIFLRLSYFMVFARNDYMEQIRKEALFIGELPAMRGRILGRSSTALAWSSRHFKLTWMLADNQVDANMQLKILQLNIPRWKNLIRNVWEYSEGINKYSLNKFIEDNLNKTFVIKQNMNPKHIGKLGKLLKSSNAFKVVNYFNRHYTNKLSRSLLGNVKMINGVEVGITGLEKKYNYKITGTPGRFEVLLDENGEWIKETWHLVQDMKPGFDIQLKRY